MFWVQPMFGVAYTLTCMPVSNDQCLKHFSEKGTKCTYMNGLYGNGISTSCAKQWWVIVSYHCEQTLNDIIWHLNSFS